MKHKSGVGGRTQALALLNHKSIEVAVDLIHLAPAHGENMNKHENNDSRNTVSIHCSLDLGNGILTLDDQVGVEVNLLVKLLGTLALVLVHKRRAFLM